MFVVLQKQFAVINTNVLSAAIQSVMGLNKFDAQARAKNTQPGMVAMGVSEAEAKQLTEQLGAGGIETVTIPMANVKPLPKDAKTIQVGTPREEGFEAADMYGRATLVPWSDCLLYSAGVISEEFRVTVTSESDDSGRGLRMAANLVSGVTLATVGVGVFFSAGGYEQETEHEEIETRLTQQMELITTHPDLRRIRIRMNQFQYACLGEQMAKNVKTNFRLFARRILAAGAEHFAFDPQLIEYVEDPAMLPAFASDADWNAYNFWQLQMR